MRRLACIADTRKDGRPSYRDVSPAIELPPRAVVPLALPPVEDQGDLGSCTANATCEAIEYLQGVGPHDVRLSRLFNYFYSRKDSGLDTNLDSGAQIIDAFESASVHGVCLEPIWPYVPAQFSAAPDAAAVLDAADHPLRTSYAAESLDDVKHALASGKPVVFGTQVFSGFDDAPGGVIPMPADDEETEGRHCIMAVEYDDEKQLVRFRNSWGTAWGDSGDGWLPYAYWEQGIAGDGRVASDAILHT